ncbi:DUF6946 family protein [uncultured Pseudodesulfovibrio sp.]|uniref:DUF6946 family protein n=1 Tax=uncultured Pseudodesulfovibrio sp. TaxID=2035858 RepID=UPI0029C792B2|nr:hypothetical protein [uncultured Pseudodesulfovibrio sp.]
MTHCFIPASSPEDWRSFLAHPEKHWKSGYSAKELAYRWHTCSVFPPEIKSLFATHSVFDGMEILFAFPEYKVSLPGGNTSSQNDLFVLARNDSGLVVIMIEGKVSEPFGETLEEWSRNVSPGKRRRLAFLQEKLCLPQQLPGHIRYQLLHRTASSLIVAEQMHAQKAIMLVHSFSDINEWFDDYAKFLALYSVNAHVGRLHHIPKCTPMDLYIGWAKGDIPSIPTTKKGPD